MSRQSRQRPSGGGFITAVSATGLLVVAWCGVDLARHPAPMTWLVFTALTVATATFALKIPSIDSTLTVSEIFAFTSILLFGPSTGAVALASLGAAVSLRGRFSFRKTLFNVANLAIAGWTGGLAFFATMRGTPLYGTSGEYTRMLAPLVTMSAVYFFVNSGLTAAAVAVSSRQSFARVWRAHFMPLAPSYLAYGSGALVVVMALREGQLIAIALVLPLLLILYMTIHTSFGRLEDSKAHVSALNRLLLSTVETLATAIDAKDEVTHDHVRRVQQGALALARELGVTDPDALKAIEAAALLHDTGKIAIPEHILNKPGRLTAAEYERMKRHAPIGAEILSTIEFPYPVTPIVRHHHENWDGSGYPDRIAGSAIPLGARILAVVDCYDALTSDRPYRRAMTDEQALGILRERRGTMYDPLVVDTFVAAYQRIMPAALETHPAARIIGEARAADREAAAAVPAALDPDVPAQSSEDLLAVASLARAVGGDAKVADIGALLWMILRQLLPIDAMAVFVPDLGNDRVIARYAAGTRASALRRVNRATGAGIVGWVAATGRAAVNADPAIDLGPAASGDTELRSCLAVSLVEQETLIAVLGLYSSAAGAFTDDHARLVDLLAPRMSSTLLDAIAAEEEAEDVAAPPPALRLVRLRS